MSPIIGIFHDKARQNNAPNNGDKSDTAPDIPDIRIGSELMLPLESGAGIIRIFRPNSDNPKYIYCII
jgi:hypothetical protein